MREDCQFVALSTSGTPRVVCAGNSERVIRESAKALLTGGIANPSDPSLKNLVRMLVVLPYAEATKKFRPAVTAFFAGYAC